ncbi:MAG TPA: hypothetical protein VFT72_19705 [Opitutaceae bacterium]|nr:hypothetical protein [Opitutaceae bacterium]
MKLARAREELEAKDLPAALAIYEELLRTSGDRADVLVTLSGDLGSCGYVEQIIELVAPRYDAERHGPATGINLVQAYLATHNTDAAQHLLDVLFSLNRPEIEERLYGFSNALAELIEAKRLGKVPENVTRSGPNGVPLVQSNVVNLVTISKPIWVYGIENVPTLLPPPKSEKTRRVAFAQLSLLGLTDLEARMKAPEDALARLTRGIPLWLAETFHYSPQYSAIAAVGTMNKEHYVTFGAEWTLQNLRQLVETNGTGLDYVFTGALRVQGDETELTLRVWEIRRFKERKVFTVRWTPATQDAELMKFADTVRMFMEWSGYSPDAVAPYEFTKTPAAWSDTLATSLSLFLTDKAVLPPAYLEPMTESLPRLAERAAHTEKASLAYLTALDRARRLGTEAEVDAALFESAAVDEARALLGL